MDLIIGGNPDKSYVDDSVRSEDNNTPRIIPKKKTFREKLLNLFDPPEAEIKKNEDGSFSLYLEQAISSSYKSIRKYDKNVFFAERNNGEGFFVDGKGKKINPENWIKRQGAYSQEPSA